MLNDVSLDYAFCLLSVLHVAVFGASSVEQEALLSSFLNGIINCGRCEGRGCTISVQKQQDNLKVT